MSTVLYSIKDLERFSGIKAHTIRIWEQRYALLHPTRTVTNIRRYSEADLKKLLNAAALSRMGYKISKIAAMTADETTQILTSQNSQSDQQVHQLNVLRIAMLNFDEALFLSAVQAHVETHGVEHVVENVLQPFLIQVGILWQTNAVCTAHRNFISNLIRQFLSQQVASLPIPPGEKEPIVFLLLENELHELDLLFLHYRHRRAGVFSIYLGQSVLADDLNQVAAKYPAVHFVGYCANKDSTRMGKVLSKWASSGVFNSGRKMSLIGQELTKPDHLRQKYVSFYRNATSFLQAYPLNSV